MSHLSASLSWPAPEMQAIDWLSYSAWLSLRRCGLRAAFARDQGMRGWDRVGPATALGRVRHKLVEDVHRGLSDMSDLPAAEWVRSRFDELIDAEHAAMQLQWAPAQVPSVKQWNDVVYVRTWLVRQLENDVELRRSQGLASGLARPPAAERGPFVPDVPTTPPRRPTPVEPLVEAWFHDNRRRLRGQLDRVVVKDGQVVVVDLKSGVGVADDALVAKHRDQLLFYAGLVESLWDEWPRLALLTPNGVEVPITYVAADVERIRAMATSDRNIWNTAAEHVSALTLARPGRDVCAWCPFQVLCRPLCDAWDQPMLEVRDDMPRRAVSLAVGHVLHVRSDQTGVDIVIEQERDLTAPAGEISVVRLPAKLVVEPTDMVVVSGVEIGGGPRTLRARWDSRIRIVPPGNLSL